VSVRLDSNEVLLQGGASFSHTLVGEPRHNRHDLRSLLQPGRYNLTVYQPKPLTGAPAMCVPYGLTVHIAPYSNQDDHGAAYCAPLACAHDLTRVLSGCLGFVLPWDLNRAHSGSEAFGGPVDAAGVLTLFGDQFRFPAMGRSSDSVARLPAPRACCSGLQV
jgi:hypothetical protein